jgi:hypothetical protein
MWYPSTIVLWFSIWMLFSLWFAIPCAQPYLNLNLSRLQPFLEYIVRHPPAFLPETSTCVARISHSYQPNFGSNVQYRASTSNGSNFVNNFIYAGEVFHLLGARSWKLKVLPAAFESDGEVWRSIWPHYKGATLVGIGPAIKRSQVGRFTQLHRTLLAAHNPLFILMPTWQVQPSFRGSAVNSTLVWQLMSDLLILKRKFKQRTLVPLPTVAVFLSFMLTLITTTAP